MSLSATTSSIPVPDHEDHTYVADVWSDKLVMVHLCNAQGFHQYQAEARIHPAENPDGSDTIKRLIHRIETEYVYKA